jgi:anti-anti-sigma factor
MSDFTLNHQAVAGPGPPIEIYVHRPEGFAFAAVVRLRGEHDISTRDDLVRALTPMFGNILVDLSDCSFIDSTIIGVLIVDSRTRQREGQRLELLVPPENTTVARTLDISGVGSVMMIHPSWPQERAARA